MEEKIIKEIMEDKKWWQKVLIRRFKTIFITTYKLGVKEGFKLSNRIVH